MRGAVHEEAAKNFNITLNTAMQENLLGVSAGDVAYKIGAARGYIYAFARISCSGSRSPTRATPSSGQ
jgi:hypothetical protein